MADTNGSNGNGLRAMTLDVTERLVSRVGFPILVAGFLLMRLDPAVRDLTVVIRDVGTALARVQAMCEQMQQQCIQRGGPVR